MLHLVPKEINIVKISKLLAKYDIDASISIEGISLNGEISDEIIEKLCRELQILRVENNGAGLPKDDFELTYKCDYQIIDKTQIYDLLFPIVKRGEIYLCDCGSAYGSEIMGVRYVMVMQNDVINLHSAATIVVPLTSKISHYPADYRIDFSEKTLIDCEPWFIKKNSGTTFLCDQIKTIDKKRLRKYIGTLSPEVVEKIAGNVKKVLQIDGETT